MRRSTIVLSGALLLGVAGCGSPGGTAAPALAESSPGAQPSSSAVPEPSSPGGSDGPGGSAGAGPGAAGGRCRHGEVRLTVRGAPGGGAAGSQYVWLVMTNTSARTCTLYGYPGVSWVTGDDGRQVNQPAERDPGIVPKPVSLAPGASAHAQVGSPQTGNFGDECKPVAVRGYRVYLPDETAADFVPAEQTVCSADGIGRAHVGPVVVGGTE